MIGAPSSGQFTDLFFLYGRINSPLHGVEDGQTYLQGGEQSALVFVDYGVAAFYSPVFKPGRRGQEVSRVCQPIGPYGNT